MILFFDFFFRKLNKSQNIFCLGSPYVDYKIREHTMMRGMLIVGGIVKVVILYLVLVIGLAQIGVEVSILESAFLILLGALGLGFALAMGIGLGLGLRSQADEFVDGIRKNF